MQKFRETTGVTDWIPEASDRYENARGGKACGSNQTQKAEAQPLAGLSGQFVNDQLKWIDGLHRNTCAEAEITKSAGASLEFSGLRQCYDQTLAAVGSSFP